MKIGRLEVILSRWTLIGFVVGLFWLGLSLGLFADAGTRVKQWVVIRQWRQVCEQEHGVFTIDDYFMSCVYPNGGSKSMMFRHREL
jgi:hypothetical protein